MCVADYFLMRNKHTEISEHFIHLNGRPSGCPLEKSLAFRGLAFTGRHACYASADTWYPAWGADGDLYSPWTDGEVHGMQISSMGDDARTGHARIVGDDPMNLTVVDVGAWAASPIPYGGRYPCGSLIHNGIWYYGTYCLMNEGDSNDCNVTVDGRLINWGVLGPCVGFRISRDFGRSWEETPRTPSDPVFCEPETRGASVQMGAPHWVDFGRNLEHSPDGKAYLVGHGAIDDAPHRRVANLSWITGDQIYLARVTPSPETINDPTAWEFFAGRDAMGVDLWVSDVRRSQPIVDWNDHCGCVTITYNPSLRKYLMFVTDGWPTSATMDTWVAEADTLTGPWRLVTYMAKFGQQAYFVNLPSKFVSADGRRGWLCYSANYANIGLPEQYTQKEDPPGSRYALCLQEIELV